MTRTQLKRAVITLLAALAGLLLLSGSPSHAQEDGLVIRAQVRDQQRDAAGRADNQPGAGVTITVVDADGNEGASGVTDADGVVLLDVPARADYVVSLDEDTLPDGLGIAANSLAEQTVPRIRSRRPRRSSTSSPANPRASDRPASRSSPSGSPTASASDS